MTYGGQAQVQAPYTSTPSSGRERFPKKRHKRPVFWPRHTSDIRGLTLATSLQIRSLSRAHGWVFSGLSGVRDLVSLSGDELKVCSTCRSHCLPHIRRFFSVGLCGRLLPGVFVRLESYKHGDNTSTVGPFPSCSSIPDFAIPKYMHSRGCLLSLQWAVSCNSKHCGANTSARHI